MFEFFRTFLYVVRSPAVRPQATRGAVMVSHSCGSTFINVQSPLNPLRVAKTFLKAKVGLDFLLQPMSQLNVGPYGRLQLKRAKPFAACLAEAKRRRVAGHLSNEMERNEKGLRLLGCDHTHLANDVLRITPLSSE